MTEDYKDAAFRHWKDAEHLALTDRWPNADQLYAFAAECAIKSKLMEFPNCVDSGSLNKKYWAHMNELWKKIPLQNIQKSLPGFVAYVRAGEPFDDWDVKQRYYHSASIGRDVALSHKDAVKRIFTALGFLGSRRG